MFTFYDKCLITFLTILAIIIMLIFYLYLPFFATSSTDNVVNIFIGKTHYATYDLYTNNIYTIENNNSFNTIKIINGNVKMINASCNDQYCVNHSPINKNYQTIVCLPNKLVIEIDSSFESGIDSISQ